MAPAGWANARQESCYGYPKESCDQSSHWLVCILNIIGLRHMSLDWTALSIILIVTAFCRCADSLVESIILSEYDWRSVNGDIIRIGKDLSALDQEIDCYSPRQHISCLPHTWTQPVTPGSKWIRGHFNLAAGHNMLLRDEDLRRLSLAGKIWFGERSVIMGWR
jgi:hypothetical protein